MAKYNLHLQHKEIASHNEYWTVQGQEIVALSICPENHPSRTTVTMTKAEALRQYALLTSSVENWEMMDSDDTWHNFVENGK